MGTPQFAIPSLQKLLDSRHQVLAVCTQPDRPAGRGHKLTASPIKQLALAHNLPVLQPETLKFAESKDTRAQLKELGADIFVVAAYGLLLPKGILEMPQHGCINVHGSLLPRYRGAAPIHAALLNGDGTTGITIMHMAQGLDTGDMILKGEIPILPGEKFTSLHDRMAELGAKLLVQALDELEKGTAAREVQDDADSCYAPMIAKTDAQIDWASPSEKIVNMTRAFDPWPGAYTLYEGEPVKIWTAEKTDISHEANPGTIICNEKRLLIKTADGVVAVTEIQGFGSKRMATADFLRGREVVVGKVLGASS